MCFLSKRMPPCLGTTAHALTSMLVHLAAPRHGACSWSSSVAFYRQPAAVALGFHYLQLAIESNAGFTHIEIFLLEFGKRVEQDLSDILVFTCNNNNNNFRKITLLWISFFCFLMSRFSLEVWLLVGWVGRVCAIFICIYIVFFVLH